MDLTGKKVVFLGDSITEGVGVSSQELRYPEVFADLTDTVISVDGISGTRVARQHQPTVDNPRFDLCFLDRADTLDVDADVIVVFGGTNDFGHGDAALGSFADRDEYTFYGALHGLLRRLITRFPDALIVYMSPLHRLFEGAHLNGYGQQKPALSAYVQAIREVCEYYSVPVLDLYASSGMQPALPVIRERYMPDGLHPSDLGARRVAERLAAFLRAI